MCIRTWRIVGEWEMADNNADMTGRTGEIVAGSIALATLILADNVTALHPLFGVPLFIYLIRDFRKRSSLRGRLIVSMATSFVLLLFSCYPIQMILDRWEGLPDWDTILAIQWFLTFPWIWAIKAECELRRPTGDV